VAAPGRPAGTGEIYTVGHSNHSAEHLCSLLIDHRVEVVADVRSVPRSAYAPWHDRRNLARSLELVGIEYAFLGAELGGRPPEDDFYDDEGHVRYDLVAASPRFRRGIERLLELAGHRRVALLCSEEDPEHCHRRLLVGRVLAADHNVTLRHIRGDGRVETEERVELAHHAQPSLFDDPTRPPWRSSRSVSPDARPRTSSKPSGARASAG
jgi:uncharacterized protein (DUF488 family)